MCLSRKLNETIHITTPQGDVIVIQVREIDRGKVMLGIEADRSVTIMRSELLANRKVSK